MSKDIGLEIDPAVAEETLKRMTRSNSESGMLKGLLATINSPEFSEDVDGSAGLLSAPVPDPMPREEVIRAPVPVKSAARVSFPDKIFTTGRLKSGKDFFLNSIGCALYGFAEPLYELQRIFFGTDDKTAPGARAFLQAVGQWGRGTINAQYPLTAARAVFVTMIRAMGPGGLVSRSHKVDWEKYGKDENIWLDALVKRMATDASAGRIGVSNVRFQNEFDRLSAEGFTHFHVMCSPATWLKRLLESKLDQKSPAVNDISESMASKMDAGVLAQIKRAPTGPKLRVVWSDNEAPSPSPRFVTPQELVDQKLLI